VSCPWSELAPSAARFCEASRCAWVRQPGNTWSNAGFVLVAIAMAVDVRKNRHEFLHPVVWITILMGFGSAFFHASETLAGELLDYAGMFSSGAFMLTVCLRRLGLGRPAWIVVFWILFAASMTALQFGEVTGRWVYLGQGVGCLALELRMFLDRRLRARDYRWWWAFWGFFAPAAILWTLDLNGQVCNPENHVFSGHAAWHLLAAGGFWASYRYYAQFEALRATE
jgi:hypothetical protein